MTYPILEFDPTRVSFIEPSKVVKPRDVPDHCVISFFKDLVEKVAEEHDARILVQNSWEDGPHPLYEIEYQNQRLAFFHPGVGGPLAVGLFEEVVAFGCRKFVVCGGCGVLVKGLDVGGIVVVTAAVRDEGVSYHYLPPGREVEANPVGLNAIEKTLSQHEIPYHLGKSWTIDAPYRETPNKIAARKAEGCITVEMEAASLMAVAQFRRVVLGQLLYGGDDLSGLEWDNRDWQSKNHVRENLFWLSAEACLRI